MSEVCGMCKVKFLCAIVYLNNMGEIVIRKFDTEEKAMYFHERIHQATVNDHDVHLITISEDGELESRYLP